MGRWQPDARGRLQLAALELYLEHGYEQTTVSEIAARAGLTERTFFRHFADKREVIFDGQDEFRAMFVSAVAEAPDDATPLQAVAAALHGAAAQFEPRRPWSLQRQRVVAANPSLQERELIKLSGVATAIAAALRDRGVGEPTASLIAQAGMGVFHVAFARWIADDNTRPFSEIIAESLAVLNGAFAG
jgi:AcrR family transcriptional regulator